MKQTNLDGVKEVAKIFLAMKPIRTEMSPAIVIHPFTDSGYALVSVKEGVIK
jgi:hypothetical protein